MLEIAQHLGDHWSETAVWETTHRLVPAASSNHEKSSLWEDSVTMAREGVGQANLDSGFHVRPGSDAAEIGQIAAQLPRNNAARSDIEGQYVLYRTSAVLAGSIE